MREQEVARPEPVRVHEPLGTLPVRALGAAEHLVGTLRAHLDEQLEGLGPDGRRGVVLPRLEAHDLAAREHRRGQRARRRAGGARGLSNAWDINGHGA